MNIKYFLLLTLSLAIHTTSYSMEGAEGVTEIWLVRHGETTYNKDQKYIGGRSIGIELTQNGIDQAYALGEYLKNLNLTFDYMYCSTAKRTKKTLECCFPSKEYTTTEQLLELDQGDWEGKLRDQIYSRENVILALKEDNWNFIPGDLCKGESQNQVAQRMKAWIIDIAREHKGKRVIAFSHGLAIKFLLAGLCDYINKSTAFKIPIDNTSITIISAEHDLDKISFSVIKQNDTTHLKEASLSTIAAFYDDK